MKVWLLQLVLLLQHRTMRPSILRSSPRVPCLSPLTLTRPFPRQAVGFLPLKSVYPIYFQKPTKVKVRTPDVYLNRLSPRVSPRLRSPSYGDLVRSEESVILVVSLPTPATKNDIETHSPITDSWIPTVNLHDPRDRRGACEAVRALQLSDLLHVAVACVVRR